MPSIPHVKEAECVWLDNVVYARAEKRLHLSATEAVTQELPPASEPLPETGANKAGKRKNRQRTGDSSGEGKQEEKADVLPAEKVSQSVSHPTTDGKQEEKVAVSPAEKACAGPSAGNLSALADEIARARQHIKNSLQCPTPAPPPPKKITPEEHVHELTDRIEKLELDNLELDETVRTLLDYIHDLEGRIIALEKASKSTASYETPARKVQPAGVVMKEDDDDEVDLFASEDEDDEENEKLKQERLQAYEAKKCKKPALIAKSNVILDVKPWDDETDMKQMERKVREIGFDGLVWGASKLVPLAYGIQKLQISCVVEDEKVSVDLLQEHIEGLEDLVQSMDIAAFNKV